MNEDKIRRKLPDDMAVRWTVQVDGPRLSTKEWTVFSGKGPSLSRALAELAEKVAKNAGDK